MKQPKIEEIGQPQIEEVEMGGHKDLLIECLVRRLDPAQECLERVGQGIIDKSEEELKFRHAVVNHLQDILWKKDLEELVRLSHLNHAELMKQDLVQDGFESWHYRDVEFDLWARMSVWTLEECTALALGLDPAFVNWNLIGERLGASTLGRRYRDVYSLVKSAVSGGFLKEPIFPIKFLSWADREGIATPTKLRELVGLRRDGCVNWQVRCDELERSNAVLKAEVNSLKSGAKGGSAKQLLHAADKLIVYLLAGDAALDPLAVECPEITLALCEEIASAIRTQQNTSADPKTIRNAICRAIDDAREHRKLNGRTRVRETLRKVKVSG